MSKRGLDADVPRNGVASNAYEVACTALFLRGRAPAGGFHGGFAPARHAVTLHRISGRLHRIAERQCSEDLTCPDCQGGGWVQRAFKSKEHGGKYLPLLGDHNRVECRACSGRGNTLGRQESRLEDDARHIAKHYGLWVYFQGDPRGCSLYLIDPAIVPTDLHSLRMTSDSTPTPVAVIQARWIASNYNRGHAVTRIGR